MHPSFWSKEAEPDNRDCPREVEGTSFVEN